MLSTVIIATIAVVVVGIENRPRNASTEKKIWFLHFWDLLSVVRTQAHQVHTCMHGGWCMKRRLQVGNVCVVWWWWWCGGHASDYILLL